MLQVASNSLYKEGLSTQLEAAVNSIAPSVTIIGTVQPCGTVHTMRSALTITMPAAFSLTTACHSQGTKSYNSPARKII